MKPHRGSRKPPLSLQGLETDGSPHRGDPYRHERELVSPSRGPGVGVRADGSAASGDAAIEAEEVLGPPLSVPLREEDDHRSRKCIATGQVLPEEKLIRFAAGPGGVVVPDVARKLPGRGIWVEANRAAVDQAVKKNAFSRAAKAQLKAPADLADQVENLLRQRILQGLGLARRAGELTWGYDRVSKAIAAGQAAWMIEASDGAADGRRKLLQIAARQDVPPRLIGAFSEVEIGLALGLENVIHLAFLAGRGAGRWTLDVERLSGFRPLLPESWREEP